MASNTPDVDIEAETAAEPAEPAETGSGLDENIAGVLSYLFGFLSGLIFFLVEKENQFVRFHAAQSMVFSGLLFLAYVALSIVGTIVSTVMFASTSTFLVGSIVSLVIGLVWLGLIVGGFGLWIYLMVKAYRGETTRLPIAAGIADKLV